MYSFLFTSSAGKRWKQTAGAARRSFVVNTCIIVYVAAVEAVAVCDGLPTVKHRIARVHDNRFESGPAAAAFHLTFRYTYINILLLLRSAAAVIRRRSVIVMFSRIYRYRARARTDFFPRRITIGVPLLPRLRNELRWRFSVLRSRLGDWDPPSWTRTTSAESLARRRFRSDDWWLVYLSTPKCT